MRPMYLAALISSIGCLERMSLIITAWICAVPPMCWMLLHSSAMCMRCPAAASRTVGGQYSVLAMLIRVSTAPCITTSFSVLSLRAQQFHRETWCHDRGYKLQAQVSFRV